MPSNYIGSGRSQAVYRLLFALVHVLTSGIILMVQFLLAILAFAGVFLIDGAMQLVLGDGLDDQSRKNATIWWRWPIKQLSWMAFRDPDQFPWLPTDV